jgi:hypothetical protein
MNLFFLDQERASLSFQVSFSAFHALSDPSSHHFLHLECRQEDERKSILRRTRDTLHDTFNLDGTGIFLLTSQERLSMPHQYFDMESFLIYFPRSASNRDDDNSILETSLTSQLRGNSSRVEMSAVTYS